MYYKLLAYFLLNLLLGDHGAGECLYIFVIEDMYINSNVFFVTEIKELNLKTISLKGKDWVWHKAQHNSL